MRFVPILAIALGLSMPTAAAFALLVLDEPTGEDEIIVGYHNGELDAALQLVRSLGATVLTANEDLRILVVSTRDAAHLVLTLGLAPIVEFVERNDPTRTHGAQWNGAQWNGAQWNGAQWNGAQWNGAQWNGAAWNGSQGEWAPRAPHDPGLVWQWGTVSARAPLAWNETRGDRVATLCVLDSGVAWDHPDLQKNIARSAHGVRSFNAINPNVSAYDDGGGHGTHVAGVAAAEVRNSFGIAGVGNVQVLPVKVLSANGTGKEDDLALGIVWCADQGADVALMALGVDNDGPTLRRAIEYADARDVLLVASAGNSGGAVGFPASHPDVMAVSAYARDDRLAGFSSRGAEVDLSAPGVEILGTFPGDRFVYGSGTSQAAALVAGAAALVRDTHPQFTASQTRDVLQQSARDLGTSGKDASFGHGAVNVAAALSEG